MCKNSRTRLGRGSPPFALPASNALVMGDFEMVQDTMDNARHCSVGLMENFSGRGQARRGMFPYWHSYGLYGMREIGEF